jgi:hypothetical protein
MDAHAQTACKRTVRSGGGSSGPAGVRGSTVGPTRPPHKSNMVSLSSRGE